MKYKVTSYSSIDSPSYIAFCEDAFGDASDELELAKKKYAEARARVYEAYRAHAEKCGAA